VELQISFKGPICDCECQDLAWSINYDTIKVFCKQCHTVVCTEHSRLTAAIRCDPEYPGGFAVHTGILEKLPNNKYRSSVAWRPKPSPNLAKTQPLGTLKTLYELDKNGKPVRAR